MALADIKLTSEQILLTSILDKLSILCWQNTKDAAKGRNFPKSLLDNLLEKTKEPDTKVFDSIESFQNYYNSIFNKE